MNILKKYTTMVPKTLKKNKEISKEKFLGFLNSIYDKALTGEPSARFISAEHLAENYLEENISNSEHKNYQQLTCENIVFEQTKKTSTSGFLSGLGGMITMPVTMPTDLYITLLVEIRMILAIAYIGGYSLSNEHMKTYTFMILSGEKTKDILIKIGLEPVGQNITYRLIQEIPPTLITSINTKLGFLLFSEYSSKGLLHIGLAVPVIGGILGGGVKYYFTKKKGYSAMKTFIQDSNIKSIKQ